MSLLSALLEYEICLYFQARDLTIAINYKLHKIYVVVSIIIAVSIAFILAAVSPIVTLINGSTSRDFHILFEAFGYIVINIVRTFFVMQINFVCESVRSRFRLLNEAVKSSIFNQSLKIKKTRSLSVFRFLKHYHVLCDAIEISNETFTLQLVPLMAIFLVKKGTLSEAIT